MRAGRGAEAAGGDDRKRKAATKAVTYRPGPRQGTVLDAQGRVIEVPAGWELLPPGDAGVTRRVKAAGEFLAVAEKRGRKVFSQGIWAPPETIARVQSEFEAERATEAYAKKREAGVKRREREQTQYVEDFVGSVVQFLNFHPRYSDQAERLAVLVAAHSTRIGSGTVARTRRIPIEQRASAAVIAWLRHQTTDYDSMRIKRVRGERRAVRRQLAAESLKLLGRYRSGEPLANDCPLARALAGKAPEVQAEHDDHQAE